MGPPPEAGAWLEEGLRSGAIRTREDLQRAKQEAVRAGRAASPLPDRELAAALPAELRQRHAALLRTKPTRSQSGVAVVAVMSSPAGCPHGKCTFCPGGPEVGVPQSYTGFEPSTMRAARLAYDPYRIVRTRLAQLAGNGHAVGKVEIVVQGGTFPARDPAYQDWFAAGIYAGCNAGPGDGAWEPEAAWHELGEAERSARLRDLMRANEAAPCRVVGLTVETKPDWCLEAHVDGMLRLGATRVEVGLQALDDDVLRATHRGHTLAESEASLRIARDAGLKVCAHMMPGLPRTTGSPVPAGVAWERRGELDPDPGADVEDMRRLFAEPRWRPDMLKVYPTLVVQEGETTLKAQWRRGAFHPYPTATAAQVVALGKAHVPEWCRIQRVDRDIPTTHVEAGVLHSNLRQLTQAEMARRGLPPCRCIRCREAGRRPGVDAARLRLVRRDYEAGGGREAFLAFEDAEADALVGFLRLRSPGDGAARPGRPEASAPGGVAFVRELKVHGLAADVGEAPADEAWQHRGIGAALLAEAERIAFGAWGKGRLLVLAGPGVKPYYRRLGYVDNGPYVAKEPRDVDLQARPHA